MKIDMSSLVYNPENSKTAQKILSSKTGKELDIACANWALEYIAQLGFKTFPSPPHIIAEFQRDKQSYAWKQLTKEERYNAYKKVSSDPTVVAYREKFTRTLGQNLSNTHWLEKYIDLWLGEGDREKAIKCWNVYNGYPESMGYENQEPTWYKRVDFKAKNKDPIIQAAIGMFGGKIVDVQPGSQGDGGRSTKLDVSTVQQKDSGPSSYNAKHQNKSEALSTLFTKPL